MDPRTTLFPNEDDARQQVRAKLKLVDACSLVHREMTNQAFSDVTCPQENAEDIHHVTVWWLHNPREAKFATAAKITHLTRTLPTKIQTIARSLVSLSSKCFKVFSAYMDEIDVFEETYWFV
jgi:hypothetical protein